MPYTLDVDGRQKELGTLRYLLSPKDLAAFDLLPDLVKAGVCSFKIEGRLKTPEYVANVTATYRKALDQALARRPVRLSGREIRDLEQSFSRGLSHGFLAGVDHQRLVEGRNPKKRGVFLGYVADVDARARVATLVLESPLKRGDGVVFEGPDPEQGEEGGPVFDLRVHGKSVAGEVVPPAPSEVARSRKPDGVAEPFLVEVGFGRERGPDLTKIEPGTRVFKTSDPELEARLRATFDAAEPRRRAPITLRVAGQVGAPLAIVARDDLGNEVAVASQMALERARNRPLTKAVLTGQLGRLGGTIFRLAEGDALACELTEEAILPLSELSRLRRELVQKLDQARAVRRGHAPAEGPALERLRATQPAAAPSTASNPADAGSFELSVLVRDDEQVEAALEAGVERIYLDYLDMVGLGRAVERVRAAGRRAIPATTRVAKPGEERIVARLLELGGGGLLARHLGALEEVAKRRAADDAVAAGLELVGDFSLNAANGLTAEALLERGVDLLTPSFDLDAAQLLQLVRRASPARLEVVIHQHLPLFHMEHCVFAHLLSNGSDFNSCGRPCERHSIGLKDDKGWLHPVLADVGCRNTLFHDRPQSAAEWLPQFRAAGLRRFRVELLRERRGQALEVLELYRRALRGELAPRELFRTLNAEGRFGVVGVTRGTLPIVASHAGR
jgi:putative protease